MTRITLIKLPGFGFSQDTDIAEKLSQIESEYLSSRILDLQIKSVMHSIERDLLHNVLDGLEKVIMGKGRTQSSWAVAFAITIILCLVVEEMQKAAQEVVMKTGGSKLDSSEQKLVEEACLALEEFINTVIRLFHDTLRLRKGSNRGKGFDALSISISPDGRPWCDDPAAEEMVHEFLQLASGFCTFSCR